MISNLVPRGFSLLNPLMKTMIALMLAAGCLCAADRPNVVLIFLDDAAYSDFHPSGNPPSPTLAALAGAPLPEKPIDGKNIWPLMRGDEGAENPHEHYFISTYWSLDAVMTSDGKWKLHLPHGYRDVVTPGHDGERGVTKTSQIGESLFNLLEDEKEEKNVIAGHPEIAEKLRAAGKAHLAQYPPAK